VIDYDDVLAKTFPARDPRRARARAAPDVPEFSGAQAVHDHYEDGIYVATVLDIRRQDSLRVRLRAVYTTFEYGNRS